MMPEREPAAAKATVDDMGRSKSATMETRSSANPAATECGAATAETAAVNCSAMEGASSTMECGTSAVERGASTMECGASTVECGTSAVEATAASTMPAATAVASATAATATAVAGDFNCKCAGDGFRHWHGTGVSQRQRVGALRGGRQHQHRGGGKAQTLHKATDRAALQI